MDVVSKGKLRQLIEAGDEPSVSLFLPTHRVPAGSAEDRIRFGNLLTEAERQLVESGLRAPDASSLLRPAQKLLDDTFFWQYQQEGLAMFINPSLFEYFFLPIDPGELLTVGGSFHLKPLLRLLSGDGHFYVLALSQNEVRLFLGTRFSTAEIDLESVPDGLAEALDYDTVQKQLQFHTRAPGPKGKRAAMFHGHGAGSDDSKDDIVRYFRQIDAGLKEVLGEDRSPLVLAGVEYLFPLYREANTYPHLLDQLVAGNPDELKAEQLHERAWSLVEPYFRRGEKEAVLRYGEARSRGLASGDIREIVSASRVGRIDVLFAATGICLWGILDDGGVAEHHAERRRGDVDLSERAAVYTFLTGGTLYILEPEYMPDAAPLSALFRY